MSPFLPVSALFVQGMNNWEGQQATVWVGQIYHHGVPPCLPPHCSHQHRRRESPFLWLLLYMLSANQEIIKMQDFPVGFPTIRAQTEHFREREQNYLTLLKNVKHSKDRWENNYKNSSQLLWRDWWSNWLQFLWHTCYIRPAIKSNTHGLAAWLSSHFHSLFKLTIIIISARMNVL